MASAAAEPMIVAGESVGDKRKLEHMAQSETSSVTGGGDAWGNTSTAVAVAALGPSQAADSPHPVTELALPSTLASHHTLREHLMEENKKQVEHRRQLRAQRSAPYSSNK